MPQRRTRAGIARAEDRMAYKQIEYQKNDRIARVILNRPQYRNAQSRVLLEEMDDAFNDANADDDIRVIVLSGKGDHFSSGHDLGTPDEKAAAEKRPNVQGLLSTYERSRRLFLDNTLRWRVLKKPATPHVQGKSNFGGWMFAAAMDGKSASD